MERGKDRSLLPKAGILALWLLLLVSVPLVEAHNGSVAVTVPVERIVVDGDLSDWPADMVRYPILLSEYGVRPRDAEDFEGNFRIGYSEKENALYLAVEVKDESTVIDTTAKASWETSDGCEVYLDVEHRGVVVKAGRGTVKAARGTGHWQTFGVPDGLLSSAVTTIFQDRVGHLWFGTWGGVSRYDGKGFITFTTADGLAHNYVRTIMEDRVGHLWFGTVGGVSRYDGERFTTFTTKDGLAYNRVISILEDRAGHLWFGTWGGGVSLYDGLVFQTLLKEDGLADNTVQQMLQDRNGDIWMERESCMDTDALSNPLEADMAWAVRFEKPDFIGRQALLEVRERGLRNKLVGFRMRDGVVPGEGCAVAVNGMPVGRVTSARFSPYVGRGIGMAWVPVGMGVAGSEIPIRVEGRTVTGEVVEGAFYDPEGKRLRE